MAATAQELRYRQYKTGHTVDGSLAYDLDWAVRERELRHAGELPRRREQETVREKVQTVPRVQVRERQRVSMFSVLGFATVIVMAVMMLMSCIQLTVLSADTVALRNQLASLETENEVLLAQYEQMFDLTTVREAAEEAGMIQPSASQICHLDLSGGDNAVIYQKEETGAFSRMAKVLHHGVYAVVEYFD